MKNIKEIAIVIILILVITAANFVRVHIPPPAYASRQEVMELKREVAELREELKRETHPARIQQKSIDYITGKYQ